MKIITYITRKWAGCRDKGFQWLAQEQRIAVAGNKALQPPEQYRQRLDALGYKHYLYSAEEGVWPGR